MTTALPLPITVDVSANRAVSIEHPGGIVGMSPFSPRAAFLSLSLGEGRSTILTEQDVALLPKGVPAALTDAIDALA